MLSLQSHTPQVELLTAESKQVGHGPSVLLLYQVSLCNTACLETLCVDQGDFELRAFSLRLLSAWVKCVCHRTQLLTSLV